MGGILSKIAAVLRWVAERYQRFNAWYKGLYAGKPWYVKSLMALCTLVVTLVLTVVAININLLWLFGKSPSLSEIMSPRPYNASYIYSADGKLIGKYYKENRTPVKYEEVDSMFFVLLIDTALTSRAWAERSKTLWYTAAHAVPLPSPSSW